MTYYHVSNIYERKFKKLDNARKYAIEVCKSNPYSNRANVSAPVSDDKNRHVGDVVPTYRGYEWRVTHWVYSPNASKNVRLYDVWVLNKDGSLGKKISDHKNILRAWGYN